ncbi:MAG: YitT family protein [Bacilli bacterium]|jgi:uncharacterized membrane-anchored protein YitT (DUF2179 family)
MSETKEKKVPKVKFSKAEKKQIAKNYTLIFLGTILMAIASGIFLIPAKINAGGLGGLAIVINHLTGFDPDLTVIIATWILFFIGLPILGWRFTLKSLVSSIVYPLFLMLMLRSKGIQDFVARTFLIEGETDLALSILAAIFGGALMGIGVGLTFMSGGSTGGVDILVFIINKYTRIKTSYLVFIVDGLIIVFGIFAMGDFVYSLVGILAALMSSLLIDFVFVGGTSALYAYIISADHSEEINEFIHNKLERGSTIVHVEGGHKGDMKRMIIVSFSRKQYADIVNGVARIDKKAFMMISPTQEVLGEGFNELPSTQRSKKRDKEK